MTRASCLAFGAEAAATSTGPGPRPWSRRGAALGAALAVTLAATGWAVAPRLARAADPVAQVRLDPAVVDSERISGYRGSIFVLGTPATNSPSGHAIFGVASSERRDHPCSVTVSSEDVNGTGAPLDLVKDLCGGSDRSAAIVAAFDHRKAPQRVFVTGVRVCLNDDGTRVKGLQIRGASVDENGYVRASDRQPQDQRAHCNDGWANWAACPHDDEIAVAVVAHYAAGAPPRSLTGLGLQCRRVIHETTTMDYPCTGGLCRQAKP